MRLIQWPFFLLAGVVCAACTTQDMVSCNGKARFSEYPDSLFFALKSACDGPAQTFARPSENTVECREYLPPEPTASIILTYDGVPDRLPQLVISFQTEPDSPGYLVENDVYIDVPQKSGPSLQVRQKDARMNRILNDLYRSSGGVPEP